MIKTPLPPKDDGHLTNKDKDILRAMAMHPWKKYANREEVAKDANMTKDSYFHERFVRLVRLGYIKISLGNFFVLDSSAYRVLNMPTTPTA